MGFTGSAQFGVVSVPGQFHFLNLSVMNLSLKSTDTVEAVRIARLYANSLVILFIQLSQSSLFKRAQCFSIPRTICTNCHCTFPSIIELYSKPRKRPKSSKENAAKEIIFAYTDSTN